MKKAVPFYYLAVLAVLVLGGCGKPATSAPTKAAKKAAAPGAAAANPASAVPTPSDELPRVVAKFEDDPRKGRDPFFPNSERRGNKLLAANSPAVKKAPSAISNLVLRAIIASRPPRAWINNRSFQAHEEGEVKLPGGGAVRIRCIEIRDKDVTIELEGAQHKLSLLGSR